MTADERIEALLSRFGQTISDLPTGQPDVKRGLAYSTETRLNARLTAARHCKADLDVSNETVMADYICHLADVIDRMETALSNAAFYIDGVSSEDSDADGQHDIL